MFTPAFPSASPRSASVPGRSCNANVRSVATCSSFRLDSPTEAEKASPVNGRASLPAQDVSRVAVERVAQGSLHQGDRQVAPRLLHDGAGHVGGPTEIPGDGIGIIHRDEQGVQI